MLTTPPATSESAKAPTGFHRFIIWQKRLHNFALNVVNQTCLVLWFIYLYRSYEMTVAIRWKKQPVCHIACHHISMSPHKQVYLRVQKNRMWFEVGVWWFHWCSWLVSSSPQGLGTRVRFYLRFDQKNCVTNKIRLPSVSLGHVLCAEDSVPQSLWS